MNPRLAYNRLSQFRFRFVEKRMIKGRHESLFWKCPKIYPHFGENINIARISQFLKKKRSLIGGLNSNWEFKVHTFTYFRLPQRSNLTFESIPLKQLLSVYQKPGLGAVWGISPYRSLTYNLGLGLVRLTGIRLLNDVIGISAQLSPYFVSLLFRIRLISLW